MVELTRRGLFSLGALGAVAGLAGCVRQDGATAVGGSWGTVGLSPFGRPVLIRADPPVRGMAGVVVQDDAVTGAGSGAASPARLVPGSRVVADGSAPSAAVTAAVEAEQVWLAYGMIPGAGTRFEEMARSALLDLRVLLRPRGALVDSWGPDGGTVEPRAAALGAAALAACGHVDDALDVLHLLASVQQPDGGFFDRYPVGQRSPDPPAQARTRVVRLENTGWALWAADRTLRRISWRRQGIRFDQRLRYLIIRSFTYLMSELDDDGLPPAPGPQRQGWSPPVPLSVAAASLAGLRAAVSLQQRTSGGRVQTFSLANAVMRLDDAITRAFGPGYPAVRGGRTPGPDITFLLPPFGPEPDGERVAAVRRARSALRRPVGVMVPGRTRLATAQLAQFALADAYNPSGTSSGVPSAEAAAQSLAWLDAHRTSPGSLPAAVRFDGSPVGPAPSTRSAALVLLALARLEGLDPD